MGKSQQTFNKKERDKKKAKKKKDKQERREQRKMEKAQRGKLSLEEQFMYVSHDGSLVKEKPDPTKKVEIKADQINLGAAPNSHEPINTIRRGKVKFFDESKGYGFITDKETKDSIFVHANDSYEDIRENHIVEFELGEGPKGKKAIRVKQIK
ncbi:MAG: cold shock domain-containing protein [Saprospiraceae bacterium]|nr:cold shock domain-containing protein [Saprospiraceae bacterium]